MTHSRTDIGAAEITGSFKNEYVEALLNAYFARIEAEAKADNLPNSWLTEVVNPVLADEYHTKKVLRAGWLMLAIIVFVGAVS